MAASRAFKGLANLRDRFEQPLAEDELAQDSMHDTAVEGLHQGATNVTLMPRISSPFEQDAFALRQAGNVHPVSPLTGKVDRRRLRKVLKTPSVSLSVAVRSELHEEVSTMIFARKSTWIAIVDELLTKYVETAKSTGHFPK
jgi:hypothetical protein